MPTARSTIVQLLVALATLPFVWELAARALATSVSESTSQNALVRFLRRSYGPAREIDESEHSFLRRLAYFWFQIAATLTCALVMINQLVIWNDPTIADGVLYGAFVYIIGPLLVGACLLRSLIYVIFSLRAQRAASNNALERTREGQSAGIQNAAARPRTLER